MAQIVNKTVSLDLTQVDGNAYALMGAFQRQARREKWSEDEIKKVLDECKKSDYDYLVGTLTTHCE